MIRTLADDEVFVFGSNTAGRHAGGAARQAHRDFDAEWGVGEGPTGRCYAFPTLDEEHRRLPMTALVGCRERFYDHVRAHADRTFLLTAVGTGIAGYPTETMSAVFVDPPDNVRLPPEWANTYSDGA